MPLVPLRNDSLVGLCFFEVGNMVVLLDVVEAMELIDAKSYA